MICSKWCCCTMKNKYFEVPGIHFFFFFANSVVQVASSSCACVFLLVSASH